MNRFLVTRRTCSPVGVCLMLILSGIGCDLFPLDQLPRTFEITPNSGPVDGGKSVVIRSLVSLPEDTTVEFGGQPATDVHWVSANVLTATTPPMDEGGMVSVALKLGLGVNAEVITLDEAYEYFYVPPDDGTDSDRDGLTDVQEITGWEIWVDAFGLGLGQDTFGNILRYTEFSDHKSIDTDGDGLLDNEEFANKSDPRKQDSDADGLFDGEEVHRWHTSPTSTDSDHDARGPEGNLPPVAALFDGLELYTEAQLSLPPSARGEIKATATSPTLDDTDGDTKTDFEEITNPTRSPLISDLPKVEIEIVDNIDIRLDTEFAEEIGQTKEFSTTLTTSTTNTNSSSESQSLGAEVGAAYTMAVEAGFPNGVSVTQSAEFHLNISQEHVWESSHETSTMTQNEFAKSQAESLTKTETSSTGSMTMGVRIRNAGDISFKLTNLGYTVRQWVPHYDPLEPSNIGEFRTMATLGLAQALQSGVTLGPLEQSPVLQVSATEVNASRIKEFLARPRSLFFEPAYFDLENAEGLNFAFAREITFARTAELSINYGNAMGENYRVATNVDRDQDGNFRGVRIADLLTSLDIDYTTEVQSPSGITVVTRVRNVPDPNQPAPVGSFWAVILAGPRFENGAVHANFEEIMVHSGERVQVVYTRDDDGDGLLLAEETIYGTSDHAVDSDDDGINDINEIRAHLVNGLVVFGGWDVAVFGRGPYRVFSDPANADADADGLNDSQERTKGTDPFKKDTDEDGLDDDFDTAPLDTAKILYVWQSASGSGTGASWADAFQSFESAFPSAQTANFNSDPRDNVSQIWVATGAYPPPAGDSFALPDRVTVYGGFTGNETKLTQRNVDPLTNGTSLVSSGGSIISYSNGGRVALDGFTLQDSSTTALRVFGGRLTARNCLFVNNTAPAGSSANMTGGTHVFEKCTFALNHGVPAAALEGNPD